MVRRAELVAQSVEHLTFNQRVMGSNPIELTIFQVKRRRPPYQKARF
jgi:hypothetical protein